MADGLAIKQNKLISYGIKKMSLREISSKLLSI